MMNCPHCNQPLAEASTFCPHCGAAVGTPAAPNAAFPNGGIPYSQPYPQPGFAPPVSPINLLSLAKAQKFLSYMIFFMILIILFIMLLLGISASIGAVLGANIGAQNPEQTQEEMVAEILESINNNPGVRVIQTLNLINYALYLLCSLIAIVPICWTCLAAKINPALMIFGILLVCCPCINVAMMIFVCVSAATVLKQHGISVGWFGANLSRLQFPQTQVGF